RRAMLSLSKPARFTKVSTRATCLLMRSRRSPAPKASRSRRRFSKGFRYKDAWRSHLRRAFSFAHPEEAASRRRLEGSIRQTEREEHVARRAALARIAGVHEHHPASND